MSGNPSGNAQEPPTTNAPSGTSGDWDGQGNVGTWVKENDLVGTAFRVDRVYPQTAGAKKRYVFAIDGGRKFSASMEGSTLGDQIARSGIPPTGRFYTFDRVPSTGRMGYALVFRVLPAGYVAGQPVPPAPVKPTAPTGSA